jgi:hypothetical protein
MDGTNLFLENIKLLESYNAHNLRSLEALQQEEILIEEESSQLSYFLEMFQRLETEAKQNDKDIIDLPDELLEKIAEFREKFWPRMTERNQALPEHRNPFPSSADSKRIKVSDITEIKGRIAYLANQQDYQLSKHARKMQMIINADYHCTNMITHQNVRDPVIKRAIEGQKTR